MALEIRHFIHVKTLRADGGEACIRVDTIGAVVESMDNSPKTKTLSKGRPLLLVYLTNNNVLRVTGENLETFFSKMSQASGREFPIIRHASPEAAATLPPEPEEQLEAAE